MHFTTFIFDIDGTITDSSMTILRTLHDLLLYEMNQKYTYDELYFVLGLLNSELGGYFKIPILHKKPVHLSALLRLMYRFYFYSYLFTLIKTSSAIFLA